MVLDACDILPPIHTVTSAVPGIIAKRSSGPARTWCLHTQTKNKGRVQDIQYVQILIFKKKVSDSRLFSALLLKLLFIILIEQQQLRAVAIASAVPKLSKHGKHFLSSSGPGFSNVFLCSQVSIHLTIELHSVVYHFPRTREQKQLKAKGEAAYNVSGTAGAPAVSCLCPGSSKIVLAAEWKNECGNEVCSLCVLVVLGVSETSVVLSSLKTSTKTKHFIWSYMLGVLIFCRELYLTPLHSVFPLYFPFISF